MASAATEVPVSAAAVVVAAASVVSAGAGLSMSKSKMKYQQVDGKALQQTTYAAAPPKGSVLAWVPLLTDAFKAGSKKISGSLAGS